MGANQKTNEKYSLKTGDIFSFENKKDIQCLKNDRFPSDNFIELRTRIDRNAKYLHGNI